jgi:hypothetical protein
MKVEIDVTGVPPKKRLEQSLWTNGVEVPRVIALRRAAKEKFGGQKSFSSQVRLRLSVFPTPTKFESTQTGDLDDFVSGACDAVQTARNTDRFHADFQSPQNQDLDPARPIAITDDRVVVSIVADRFMLREGQESHYLLVLDGA